MLRLMDVYWDIRTENGLSYVELREYCNFMGIEMTRKDVSDLNTIDRFAAKAMGKKRNDGGS